MHPNGTPVDQEAAWRRVSVMGLGKLGLPLAAVMASKGFMVVGVDTDGRIIDRLNAGIASVDEPQVQALLQRHRANLHFTTDYRAVQNTDVSFVIVPTPSAPDGTFSNEWVSQALHQIGLAIRGKAGYHLVVVTSTVVPGSMDGVLRETLERASTRPVGPTIGLCYSPEFIALGSVVRDLQHPDFVLIGESDPVAGDSLERVSRSICVNAPPVHRMTFANAELTKIAVNTFITLKISYANMLAEMCDCLPGTDVDVISRAMGCDTRIGAKYLRGALGYGGPCFPRDTGALAAVARRAGCVAELADCAERINDRQVDRLVRLVQTRLGADGNVGILGLAYKPDTSVVERSQGMALATRLAELGYRVAAYDPMAMSAASGQSGALHMMDTAEACARASDLIVITVPWPAFAHLSPESLSHRFRPTIIDCWRVLPREPFATIAELVYPGRSADPSLVADDRPRQRPDPM
jgi:UDPglucose 6-dehydrogenase